MLYAIDIETVDLQGKPCLNWRQGSILCVSICDENLNVKVLYPFNSDTIKYLNDIFADSNNTVLFWNALYDLTWLRHYGLDQSKARIYDPMLLYNLLFNKLGLDCSLRACAKQFLQIDIMEWKKTISLSELKQKNQQDVIATLKLWKIFNGILDKTEDKQVVWKYFTELLMPVIDVFVGMQLRGLRVDKDRLSDILQKNMALEGKLQLSLMNKIGNVNFKSPRQLSTYLFGRLGLAPVKEKNKSGYYPVDEEVLSELSSTNQICKDILEVRKISKTISVLESIYEYIDSATQRVYPQYNVNSAVSGRICSQNPNIQNLVPEIRSIFIPTERYRYIAGDLNQIELRIAAHLSKDEKLCEAFNSGKDLHQLTADLLNVDRKTGKTLNFGILYGMGPNSLAKRLNISQEKAKDYIDKFFKTYPQLYNHIQQVYQIVREKKYVTSILGRKRFFDEIDSRSLRAAYDHENQSSSSDFLLLILRNLSQQLKHGYIVGQVFDSVLVEVQEDYVNQAVEVVRHCMTNFIKSPKLLVPIEVEIKVLDRWE